MGDRTYEAPVHHDDRPLPAIGIDLQQSEPPFYASAALKSFPATVVANNYQWVDLNVIDFFPLFYSPLNRYHLHAMVLHKDRHYATLRFHSSNIYIHDDLKVPAWRPVSLVSDDLDEWTVALLWYCCPELANPFLPSTPKQSGITAELAFDESFLFAGHWINVSVY